jgi:single-stranded DNA-binding protein
MARLNDVWLYGAVSSEPSIARDINGNAVRGMFRLSVLRSTRKSGEKTSTENLVWDYPLILSVDADIVNKMSKLKKFDIVELSGSFVRAEISKNKTCSHCGKINSIASTLYFVNPIFMAKRNSKDMTEYEAAAIVQDNREISNHINVLGNLCNDVNYFESGNIRSSVYQIGTERKRFITADNPTVRSDFFVVRTFGHNAKMDNLCIHKGSMVAIDGYLHFKKFGRKSKCVDCGEEFEWEDSTMEIVPYIIEYLANFTDPEEATREKKKSEQEEQGKMLKQLRGF